LSSSGIVEALQWGIASRILIALSTTSAVASETIHLPECGGILDVFTGCRGFLGGLSGFLLGVVPTAPTIVNLTIASVVNAPVFAIWLASWLRGVRA